MAYEQPSVAGRARLFKEDFFERVVNVNWMHEPKCYFIAADAGGYPFQVVDSGFGGNIYFSDDGIHWERVLAKARVVETSWVHDPNTFRSFMNGLWMRQDFKPEGDPLWILGGVVQAEKGGAGGYSFFGAVLNSFDGESVKQPPPQQKFTGIHYVHQMFVESGAGNFIGLKATLHEYGFAGLVHMWESTDGYKWEKTSTTSSSVILEPPEIGTNETRKIFQLSNRSAAYGPVLKGPHAGKTLKMVFKGKKAQGAGTGTGAIDEWFVSPGKLTDIKTGRSLGTTDCKIPFASSLAYGHYVFVAVGTDQRIPVGGAPGYAMISYTEDGINWKARKIGGPYTRMWSLVVGARKDQSGPVHNPMKIDSTDQPTLEEVIEAGNALPPPSTGDGPPEEGNPPP